MSDLKSTPFESLHIAAGAKMVPFGGWNMPVQYPPGILAEHAHTRNAASLFDCSHMGQFRLRGPSVAADLDRLLPRRAGNQKAGTCRYNFLLNEAGGVIDDCIVYRVAEEHYYIVVNASTTDGDAAHMRAHLSPTTEFVDESPETAKLDLQGPGSWDVLERLGVRRDTLPGYYAFMDATIGGIPVLLSRTGYTGERGVELYFDAAKAERMWHLLLSQPGVLPAGLGARDTLRLEMGYPLYGHEMNQETTPIEAGFAKMVDLKHEFLGREALLAGPRKTLIGVAFDSRRAAREGTILGDAEGNEIGRITSGSISPSLERSIAMAYVAPGVVQVGDKVKAQVGRTALDGQVVEMPFYTRGTARQA